VVHEYTRRTVPRVIDPTSDRAVYQQIADHLREAIRGGKYAAGDRLPSESELVSSYGVSRVTARRALAVLAGEGLTYSEHGRGVFVRARPPVRRLASDRFARRHRQQGKAAFVVEMENAGLKYEVEPLMIGRGPATPEAAERLGLRDGDEVVIRRRRYLAEGHPLEIATSYIPLDIASGTAIEQWNTGPGGIYARIEEGGHRLVRFTEEIVVRPGANSELNALSLSVGSPVIRILRTAHARDRAVEVCETIMNPAAFELSYELPAR